MKHNNLREEFNRILNNKKIEDKNIKDKNITKEYEAYNKGIEDVQKVFNMLIAIEEVRENVLREYPEHIDSPEDILINMEEIYYRDRERTNPIQEDKDKYSNPPL